MAKISLITLHSVQNYGSALQTFATQCLFERLGLETEVVDYVRENNMRENLVDTGLRNSRFWNKNVLTRFAFRFLKAKDLQKRYELFDSFLQNIHLTSNRYISEADFEENPISADIYCTGSDQTWNSHWNRGILTPFFLSFAQEGKKKIAYAASFGQKELVPEDKEEIKERLSAYDYITVREEEAVTILEDLGIDAVRVLDPTLMLTGEEWRGLAAERIVNGGYILVYQLGYNRSFNRMAKKIARYKKLKLIRVGFGNDAYFYGGKVIKNPTVWAFLSLLANASYIITDSFHATCFATNLNVDFFSFLPKRFSGRITDFLSLVGLSERCFSDFEALKKCADKPIDFTEANAIIEVERQRSLDIVADMVSEVEE